MARKTGSLLLVVAVLMVGVIGCSSGGAKNYSAETVSKFSGRAQRAKMYFSGDKFRVESSTQGRKGIMIVRKDKNVAWMLMPDQKMYMETRLDPKQLVGVSDKFPGETKREKVGSEKINGVLCDKFKITYKTDKMAKPTTVYQWVSADKIPVKTTAVDGSWSSEMKNIKRGKQPAALFELPAGYKKFAMPKRVI
jgi:hypothetical protein